MAGGFGKWVVPIVEGLFPHTPFCGGGASRLRRPCRRQVGGTPPCWGMGAQLWPHPGGCVTSFCTLFTACFLFEWTRAVTEHAVWVASAATVSGLEAGSPHQDVTGWDLSNSRKGSLLSVSLNPEVTWWSLAFPPSTSACGFLLGGSLCIRISCFYKIGIPRMSLSNVQSLSSAKSLFPKKDPARGSVA